MSEYVDYCWESNVTEIHEFKEIQETRHWTDHVVTFRQGLIEDRATQAK